MRFGKAIVSGIDERELMSRIAIYGSSNTTPISWGVAPKRPYLKNAPRRCYNHLQTKDLRAIKHFYPILINTPLSNCSAKPHRAVQFIDFYRWCPPPSF
jgi:hypothetical protein